MKVHTSRRATAHHLTEGQMVVIAGCRVMDVMGGITTTLSALPNRVLDTVGVLALTVAARRALFDAKFSA